MTTATEEAAIQAAAIEERTKAIAIRGEDAVPKIWYFIRIERARAVSKEKKAKAADGGRGGGGDDAAG